MCLAMCSIGSILLVLLFMCIPLTQSSGFLPMFSACLRNTQVVCGESKDKPKTSTARNLQIYSGDLNVVEHVERMPLIFLRSGCVHNFDIGLASPPICLWFLQHSI